MFRSKLSWLLILTSIASLGVLVVVPVSELQNSTGLNTILTTAINPELLLKYSFSNVTCSSTTCIQRVIPYTITEFWTAPATHTVPVLFISTHSVAYATTAIGKIATIILLLILLAAFAFLVRKRFFQKIGRFKVG